MLLSLLSLSLSLSLCSLGYVQGMSDLLSPLLFVTQNEVESFWCLTGFMDLVVSKHTCFLIGYSIDALALDIKPLSVFSTKTLKSLKRPWNSSCFSSASYWEHLIQSCVTTWVNTNTFSINFYLLYVFVFLLANAQWHSWFKFFFVCLFACFFSLLDSQDSGSLCFCFRWLLIWFKREFSFEDILSLWEVRGRLFVLFSMTFIIINKI